MARLHSLLVLITINIAASEIKNVGWWRNSVIYQIYPRSFKDADNDGIGDLKGITSKLEHFNETGIDAVWLSPIYASPMVDFGYDISDFRKIHHEYGTEEDFDNLVKRAKELGIKVIMDLVPNHTSDKHEWFQMSLLGNQSYADYYIWRNSTEGKPPNNWISAFGQSAWTCINQTSRTGCYLHQFHVQQPDLNFRNEEVQKEIVAIMEFWLNKGVDGFRVDAIPHLFEHKDFLDEPRTNTPNVTDVEYRYLDHIYTIDQPETYELVENWKKYLDHYANVTNSDEKILMTEAYTNLKNTTKYYDLGVQVPFNFYFITGVNNASSPDQFANIIDTWLNETASREGAVANWVMGNHDKPRTESRYPGRSDQMTMLAMILPGVAVTYYGEEIGMIDKSDISFNDTQDPVGCSAGPDKYKQHSRDPERTPMQWDNSTNAGFNTGFKPWIPVHENYMTVNLAAQKVAETSHYKIYKKLIHLKKTNPAIVSGTIQTFVPADKKSLLIVRATKNESIVLIINFSQTENIIVNVTGYLPSLRPAARVEVATLASPVKEGAPVNLKKLNVAPKQSLVISTTIIKSKDNGSSGTITLSSILCVSMLLITCELHYYL